MYGRDLLRVFDGGVEALWRIPGNTFIPVVLGVAGDIQGGGPSLGVGPRIRRGTGQSAPAVRFSAGLCPRVEGPGEGFVGGYGHSHTARRS